jgi:predicted dienelactone hydrolase
MKFTTQRTHRGARLALGASPLARPRLLVALLAATLGLGLTVRTPAMAADMAQNLRVGHTVKTMVVRGSFCDHSPSGDPSCAHGENRQVDVHLWYPADVRSFADWPKTAYTSALYGKPLIPERWDPLSWQVASEVAREDQGVKAGMQPAIDRKGRAFPVIVFSHGSVNDPIDYARTLERIAGAGFVVAAPAHVNNTQDDERIDFINAAAAKIPGQSPLFGCRDGRPSPCSRTNIPRSMEDRARDISHTLDNLPHWFGDRVDMSRVGAMGHSRGTVTALAAAGGSETGTDGTFPWHFPAVQGVDAVMGLAIGGRAITFAADLADVTVPTLLVAGQLDKNSTPDVSEDAFAKIGSTEKAYVPITSAVHRSFDSTYCDQLKSAGAITQAAGTNSYGEQKAPLDWHTVRLIGTSFPGGLSGVAHQYCSADTFSNPDLTPLMTSLNGLQYVDGQGRPTGKTFIFDPAAPTTGLETSEVKQGVTELAVTFFGTVLNRVGNDGPHFTQFLAPKWLEKHVPMVEHTPDHHPEAFADDDAICPPGLDVVCAD